MFSSCEDDTTTLPFNDSPQLFSEKYLISEIIPDGYIIDTAYIEDSIILGTLIYEIIDGNEDNNFLLDRYSGILSINDSNSINFEQRSDYELKIMATDSCKHPISSYAIIKIQIIEYTPYNEAIKVLPELFHIPEHIKNNYIIDTITVRDSITLGKLKYEITSGNDDLIFKIDDYSGELSINDSSQLNYETKKNYELEILVTDSCKHPISSGAIVKINILDISPTTLGLTAYYPFDNTTNDYSNNQNNGIYQTNRTYVDGIRGKALNFNGTNDYVQLNKNIESKEGLTFSFWFNTRGYGEGQRNSIIISKYNMGGDRCFLVRYYTYEGDNGVGGTFFPYGGSGTIYDQTNSQMSQSLLEQLNEMEKWKVYNNTIIEENMWKHCVINTTPTTMETWVNGKLCITRKRDFDTYHDSSSEPIIIGSMLPGGSGSNNFFNGLLDEFRIYNRALSKEEIKILYLE